MTPDDIRGLAVKLREIAVQYDMLAKEIGDEQFDDVGVDGASKIERAMALLKSFKGKIQQAIAETQAQADVWE